MILEMLRSCDVNVTECLTVSSRVAVSPDHAPLPPAADLLNVPLHGELQRGRAEDGQQVQQRGHPDLQPWQEQLWSPLLHFFTAPHSAPHRASSSASSPPASTEPTPFASWLITG